MSRERIWLYRLAVLTAIASVLLIVAGALVTTTGSGDAVPDWPLSYGTLFPPMVGGIMFEHGHRLTAGVVAFLVLALAMGITAFEKRRSVRILGWLTFTTVVVQAVLGGARVLVVSKLGADNARFILAVVHALTAQIAICLVFSIAALLSPRWQAFSAPQLLVKKGFRFTTVLACAIVFQLLLGALMRHAGAGLIIPDFPTSYGHLVPNPTTLRSDVLRYSQAYELYKVQHMDYAPNTLESLTPSELGFRVAVTFLHRTWAFVTLGLLIAYALWTRRRPSAPDASRRLSAWMAALGLVQVVLGISVILSRKSVDLTVLHVATGATILGLAAVSAMTWAAARSIEPIEQAIVQERAAVNV